MIALPNGIEMFEASLAVWKLGAVPLPLSHRLPRHEREMLVKLAEPALVVGVAPSDHPDLRCLPTGFEPDAGQRSVGPDRVSPSWKIITSGGSTGRPKLIVSGESGLIAATAGAAMGMRRNGVVLVPGPLYHSAGFHWSWLALFLGNHVVVLPKFGAIEALQAIHTRRVDWTYLVPTMMSRILRAVQAEPDRFDLTSLAMVWHMAAPCPDWLKQAWIDLVGADKLMELYGGSEGIVGAIISGNEWLEHRGSVGKPIGGQIRIVDDRGAELPAGDVGEIFMKPDHEVSARLVGAEQRERDGWKSIGDLGRVDADGYLYISDRRVDMILSGGANVYPAEVEAALVEHPAVARAVVVGLPDEDLGQRVHAVVEAEGDLTVDELLAFLGDRLVRYKIPRSIRFVDTPLRDDADKVRRSQLRDQEIALAQTE